MDTIIFETTLLKFKNSSLWGCHFIVPTPVALTFITANDRRVIIEINNEIKLHAALMPIEEIWYVMLNQEIQKKLNVPFGGLISIKIAKDHSQYGMPMPEELREVLDQDYEGDVNFHALTSGKQRSLLYIISKVKSIAIRINKSLIIVEHLTTNIGKLDFKVLNEAFKSYSKL